MIWFTWFQVTLFDIRFARDSIFERICKAVQLAAMVGFASAGSRFATHVSDENVWAFQALTLMLAGSRVMLAIQYTINIRYVYKKLRPAAKGMSVIVAVLSVLSVVFGGVSSSWLKRRCICLGVIDILMAITAIFCLWTKRQRSSEPCMDSLVRVICNRDAGHHGGLELDARDWVRGHASQRPDGPAHVDYHRRGRHIGD